MATTRKKLKRIKLGAVPRHAYVGVGIISAESLYTRDEAMLRMGWAEPSWRAAISAGLKVHRLGKRTYVLGRSLISLVGRQKPPAAIKRKKVKA